jgi:hypothetical protein
MIPLCRVGSTVLAPLSLLYQISAVPVNNNYVKTYPQPTKSLFLITIVGINPKLVTTVNNHLCF